MFRPQGEVYRKMAYHDLPVAELASKPRRKQASQVLAELGEPGAALRPLRPSKTAVSSTASNTADFGHYPVVPAVPGASAAVAEGAAGRVAVVPARRKKGSVSAAAEPMAAPSDAHGDGGAGEAAQKPNRQAAPAKRKKLPKAPAPGGNIDGMGQVSDDGAGGRKAAGSANTSTAHAAALWSVPPDPCVYEGLAVPAVREEQRMWAAPCEGYRPVKFTDPAVLAAKAWADSERPKRKPKFNHLDGKVDRSSHGGPYKVSPKGLPLNPSGRTGVAGRGVLGRFGPNHFADPVVTRWRRDPAGEIINDRFGQPMVEIVLADRGNGGGELALPGELVPADVSVPPALSAALEGGAAAAAALWNNGVELFRGLPDDPRNTDNAWVEITVVHYHDATGEATAHHAFAEGDEAGLRWARLIPSLGLHPAHTKYILEARQRVLHGGGTTAAAAPNAAARAGRGKAPPKVGRAKAAGSKGESKAAPRTSPAKAPTAKTAPGVAGPRAAQQPVATKGPATAKAAPSVAGPKEAQRPVATKGPATAKAAPSVAGPKAAQQPVATKGPATAKAAPRPKQATKKAPVAKAASKPKQAVKKAPKGPHQLAVPTLKAGSCDQLA